MKKKIVIIIALAISVILALTLFAGCAGTTDSAFSQGMIAVQKDGLWGFADESGEIVIDCKYDAVTPFAGKYAAVTLGSRSFLIDADGNDSGIELGSFGVTPNKGGSLIIAQNKNTGYLGVIDTDSGEWVTSAIYDEMEFTEGSMVIAVIGDKYGLFNADGEELCPVEYDGYYEGGNGIIMVKNGEEVAEAVIFAADGAVINENAEILDADYLPGGSVMYIYNAAAEGAEPDYRQVIPGTAIGEGSETSMTVYASEYGYIMQETSADSVTYSVRKLDGSIISENLTAMPEVVGDNVVRIDNTSAEAAVPSYTYIDMASGEKLEHVINDTSDVTVDGVTTPAINFTRLADGSLYYQIGDEFYAIDNTSPAFTFAEDETDGGALAAGVFTGITETGVRRIYNNGSVVFETGAGQTIVNVASDGAYFTVRNAEGNIALYKNDGTQVFGFDKEITGAIFAAMA